MKICCISDTHGALNNVQIDEDTDLILHAGDFTFEHKYDFKKQANYINNDVLNWIKTKNIDFLGCWGNNDMVAQYKPELINEYIHQYIYEEKIIKYKDINIFLCAYQVWFDDWAFNTPKFDIEETVLNEKYQKITEDVSIVVSHGPPYGIADKTINGNHVGSTALKRIINKRKNPLIIITGHIHEAYGKYQNDNITVVNASCCNHEYKNINKPIYINLKEKL